MNDPARTTCVLCGKTLKAPQEESDLTPEPEPEQPAPTTAQTPRTLSPEEHIRIGELIYAAYKHKEAGAIDDAIMACQGALALNESGPAAHSLLGSLYEAKGDIPSAIYEYEKVEQLDPGNVANRQKLDHLRASPEPAAPGDKPKPALKFEKVLPYVPYAVLILIFVMVLGAGLIALSRLAKRMPVGAEQPGLPPGQGTPQTTSPLQPQSTPPVYPQGQANSIQNQPFVGPGQVQPNPTTPERTAGAQTAPANPPRAGFPQPAQSAPPQVTGTRPLISIQPAPKPAPFSQPPVIVPVPEPPKPVHTSPPKPSPPPAADPEERAVQLQSAGKYQEAVGAYKEALNRTSDSGRIYQQIAICYQRLGQKDQAVQNYRSAIRSYRDQLSAGRDPAEVQRSIRACEAGIEVVSNR